jgi:hypothetical protein
MTPRDHGDTIVFSFDICQQRGVIALGGSTQEPVAMTDIKCHARALGE